MASSVKGMTIDIGGDTSKLQAALKSLSKPIQSVQRELNNLSKSLKLEPGNTTLLTEKQKLLKNAVTESEKKVTQLKNSIKELTDKQKNNVELTEAEKNNLSKLTVELAKAEVELKNLKNQYKEFGTVAGQKFKAVGNEVSSFGNKISALGQKFTVVSTAMSGLLLNGLKYTADLQKITAGLEVATGSAEEASKVMAQIKKDAKTTPFDVKGLAQANQLLLSTGLEANKSRSLIMALGDAVAASGGGNEELQRMAYNLQQVKNLGKASSVDIRQFGMAGIDIYGLLADYLGITKEQAAETEVTFEDLSGALMKASQEGGKYYGGMTKQSQTLNGQISNLKDSFNEFTEILAKNLVPIAQTVLDKLNSLLAKFQELSPETQSLISTIAIIVAALAPALIIIGKVISAVGIIISSVGTIINLLSGVLVPLFGVIKGALVGLAAALGIPLAPLILIVGAIAAVIAILVLLYNKCEWFRNGVNAIIENIKAFFMNLFTVIGNFFTQTIPGWIDFVVNTVLPRLPYYIGYMVAWIITTIATLPAKLAEIFENIMSKVLEWLGNWLSTMQQKIPEIVDTVLTKLREIVSKVPEIGREIVEGLWEGIKNAAGWLKGKVGEFAQGVLQGMKDSLGINSPSILFRDEVGRYIAEGIGVGFNRNIGNVLNGMQSKLNLAMGEFAVTTPENLNRGNVNISMVINAQELNEQSLEQAFNYINRRFGAAI